MGSRGATCTCLSWCGVVCMWALAVCFPSSSLEVNTWPLTLCPYPSQQVLGWSTWENPAFKVLLCQKIKSQQQLTSVQQILVFQDLNATSEPRDLVEPDVSPFGLCNAFSPFLAIWLWAQRFWLQVTLVFSEFTVPIVLKTTFRVQSCSDGIGGGVVFP